MNDGQAWDNLPEDLVMDLAQLTKANSIEGTPSIHPSPLLIIQLPRNAYATLPSGNKKDNVTVIYTPWSNLKKDGSMAVGQVGFKDQRKVYPSILSPGNKKLIRVRQVKRVLVPQRENPIVNRLNKTKVETKPDLKQEKDDRTRELRRKDQEAQQQRVPIPPPLPFARLMINLTFLFLQRKEEARQAQEWKQKKYEKDHAYDDLFTEDHMAASSNQNRNEDWEDDFM